MTNSRTVYDIANTTEPLFPESTGVLVDDIRGLVVTRSCGIVDINSRYAVRTVQKQLRIDRQPLSHEYSPLSYLPKDLGGIQQAASQSFLGGVFGGCLG